MRKSVTTTKQTPSAQHASSEPPQQPAKPGTSHPANWLQQAFKFDVVSPATAKEKLNVM